MKRSQHLAVTAACFALAAAPALAGPNLSFVTHATYFAQATSAGVEIDPQVFVSDENAPDINGPQNIHHAAGVRPARLADDPSLALYNANAQPLGLSLERWLAARGTATFDQHADQTDVHFTFAKLLPFGVYTVFISRPATPNESTGSKIEPLDGSGEHATFTAGIDGTASLTVPAAHPLAANDVLVVVYHSDGAAHQSDRGALGVNAHEELALVVPASSIPAPATADVAPDPTAASADAPSTPTDAAAAPDDAQAAQAAPPVPAVDPDQDASPAAAPAPRDPSVRDPGPVTGADPNLDPNAPAAGAPPSDAPAPGAI